MSFATNAGELMRLIRELDYGIVADSSFDEAGIAYVEVRRWNGDRPSGNERDDRATALIRALLREKLGTFSVSEIGAATLAEFDEASAVGPGAKP